MTPADKSLVERLRMRAQRSSSQLEANLLSEAANCIESLIGQIAEMQADHVENFAGKVVMSEAAFSELQAALREKEAALGEAWKTAATWMDRAGNARADSEVSQSQPCAETGTHIPSSPLDLTKLEEVARGATQDGWCMSGVRGRIGGNSVHNILAGPKQEVFATVFFNERTGEGFSDAKFIGLCSPSTVLRLIELAREAMP